MARKSKPVSLATERPSDVTDAPKLGEQTGPQGSHIYDLGAWAGGLGGLTIGNVINGFGPVPDASYLTYRMMRNNATVALGRTTIHAPIKAANWTIETEDAPDGAEELLQTVIDHKTGILEHTLRMLDYGHSSFELVWQEDDGAIVPKKFKSLLVDNTTILIDTKTGAYRGLKNGQASLQPENTLHLTFDGEAGNYYGRSLFENIRQWAWWPWLQSLRRSGHFTQKLAGASLVVKYVPGRGKNKSGVERDNFDMAMEVAQAFGKGDAVVVPMSFAPWAADMIRQGVDPAKLLAWQLDYMEPGTGHVAEFISYIQMLDAHILRGLMVPERVVTEGKFGTKAESESQATIAIAFSEEVQRQILDCVNWYVVDRIMALNFGPESVGTAWINAEPLIDEKRAIIREIVKSLLGNPVNIDVWQTLTDVESQLEQVGIPVADVGVGDVPLPERIASRMGEDSPSNGNGDLPSNGDITTIPMN